MRELTYRLRSLWILSIFIGLPASSEAIGISSPSITPIVGPATGLIKRESVFDHAILQAHQSPMMNSSVGFNVLNSAIGYTGERKRDIAMDFTVVQTALALVHTCFVPLKFGVEKDGLFEEEWGTIVPVCAADLLSGLLGGHVGGMICRTWIDEDEEDIRSFIKSFTCGLFSGAIWGTVTSVGWGMVSREYEEDHEEEDIYLYTTVASTALLGSALHGIVVLFLK
jgi:hypothetical protein